jgi:hypothetical protein
MNRGQSVFAQLLGYMPLSHFEDLVDPFASNHGIRHFSARTFSQHRLLPTHPARGLALVAACLNSQHTKVYHIDSRQDIPSHPGRCQLATRLADCSKYSASGRVPSLTLPRVAVGSEDMTISVQASTGSTLCRDTSPWT